MQGSSHVRLIKRVIGPFRRRAIGVLSLLLLDTLVTSATLAMILPIFQTLLAPEESLARIAKHLSPLQQLSTESQLLWLSSGVLLLFILKAIVSIASVAASRSFSEELRCHWIAHLGERYLLGSYASLQAEKQGVLLNNWFNETAVAARFFASYLTYISASILSMSLVCLGLFVNWKATLIFLGLGSVTVFSLRHKAFGSMTRLGQLKVRLYQGTSAAMAETLLHARDLKILTAESTRLEQINQRTKDLRSVLIRVGVMAELPRIAGESLAVIALLLLLVASLLFMQTPPADVLPVLGFFFVAAYRLMTASMQAMTARMKALSDLHSLHLVQSILDDVSHREDRKVGLNIESIQSDIEFESVFFSYDTDRPIVRNLTFVIPQGQLTFLIGPSGAGKSSVLDLLLRLRQPQAGRIVANGKDIREFNLLRWRQQFGYVSQDAALFNGSIRMNLMLAKPDATDEELATACQLAGAHEFIQGFPDGYDTMVGDRGHSVSGGQRKRIAIARALIRRPSFLILDEATTSFEQSLEREMLRTLRETIPTLTIVQVTHRLQSASQADHIIVLDHGAILAQGDWPQVQSLISQHPTSLGST